MVLPFYLFTFLPLSAQSYLDHLQQKTQGLGTVSVTQSKELNELINGTAPVVTTPKTPTAQELAAAEKEKEEKEKEEKEKEEAKERQALRPDMPKTDPEGTGEVEVDMSKKVMRGAQKVNGFRVQVFAGGNSRADKQKAEEAGRVVKRAYPSEPIYVHFYSPRWICRMGNYRTQEEARRMLANVKKLGYKQAVIVKGKISVQY
ncbi:MAG: SPOR domain-containing protein [Prevotella sp.]|nr:SPOR domain-containing protein [Prevotella sp.]